MRIHVTHYDKVTTISIDDQLVDYLGAILVKDDPKSWEYKSGNKQRKKAIAEIKRQLAVDASYGLLPTKNLSQHVRKMVIKWIAHPAISKILAYRNPPDKKTRAKKSDVGKPLTEEAKKAFEALAAMQIGRGRKPKNSN